MDAKLQPQRQMVESDEVVLDGLTWTFGVRPGLKFYDGESVLAKDAVASIDRWAAREPIGQMIKAIENEIVAADSAYAIIGANSNHVLRDLEPGDTP